MIKLSVMYPRTADLRFDLEYYRETHVPTMRRLVGERLKGFSFDSGLSAPGIPAATYAYIATLLFESLEEMQAALAEQGATLAADILNYTNTQPVIQVSETSE